MFCTNQRIENQSKNERLGCYKTSKKYFCSTFSDFFVRSWYSALKTTQKVLQKYFFGCFVTTTSLIFRLIFFPFATKHPNNTFAVLFWMFGWYLYYVRPKQPKRCCRSIFWMFCTNQELIFLIKFQQV